MNEYPKINPCPCCGGPAKLVISNYENSDTSVNHKIMCCDVFGCGLEMFDALSYYSPNYHEEVENLIERWNRRTAPPEQPKMTKQEAVKWLQQIKDRYILDGDEDFDNKRRAALDMAVECLQEIEVTSCYSPSVSI